MFGIRNFTGAAFISSFGNATIAFGLGLFDELTIGLNVTSVGAAEIPQNLPENCNIQILTKEKISALAATTVVSCGSKIAKRGLSNVISAATHSHWV